jgi:glyoxylase-like metal-dependent hydrolase (beta-lactamase superfamily II)
MRLSAPGALSPAPDVRVARSYDFGDFAFIQTSAGVVAIDAGTSPDRVRAAMADLGLTDHAPVSHLILTHAHLDHADGTAAVRGPDTQVIASAGFPAEADRLRHWNLPFRYFTGTGASPASDVQPDRLISERTSVVVGGTEFVLIPVRGGETPDAPKKQRRPSTCSPGKPTPSPTPRPPWPARATWPSPWTSSPRACSAIPAAAS